MFVATIQLLCLCFGTELGMRLQSRSVVDDQVAGEASKVALESDCFFVAGCHHEELLGVGRCTWRSTFSSGSLGLSDRDGDIQNTDVVTSKTDDDRLQTEIKTFTIRHEMCLITIKAGH